MASFCLKAHFSGDKQRKITLSPPSASSVQGCARKRSSHPKVSSAQGAQLVCSPCPDSSISQSLCPRPPLTGLHWPLWAGPLVTVDTHPPTHWGRGKNQFLLLGVLGLKVSSQNRLCRKPVGVFSLPANEGPCWPRLCLLFQLACAAKGRSLQGRMLCTSSLLQRLRPSQGGQTPSNLPFHPGIFSPPLPSLGDLA